MWIEPNSNTVFHLHSEIRGWFRDVSMPETLNDAVIASLGLLPVMPTDRPRGYVVEEVQPALSYGVWVQQWAVRPPTEQETVVEAAAVRAKRKGLLTECDWTQTLDAPVDREAWSAYRQQLRDITEQGGFPWEVEWPSMPA